MVAMELPPVAEAIRQALSVPPPAFTAEAEPAQPKEVRAFVAWQDDAIANFAARNREYANLLASAVGLLVAEVESGRSNIGADAIGLLTDAARGAVEIAKAEMRLMERSSQVWKVRFQQTPQAKIVKRNSDRIVDAASIRHDSVVRQYQRLAALQAEFDPEAADVIHAASSSEDIDAFFASLNNLKA